MCNGPVLLPGIVSGEQTIVHAIPNLLQAASDGLGKTLLVADFIDELVRADKDP